MAVSAYRLLGIILLLVTATTTARVSQRLVGGHAKVDASASKKTDEAPEEKKTLSQQVAEGKYGLIQTEIFQKPPERPGVISYEKNPEVPKDDENSLGGLGPDDIWLAEDHLLVLKGGSFHRTASEMPWPPIDDYKAPNRQVKIPSQPKIPPPFPVQLAEGGPVQLLGVNFTGAVNGTFTLPSPDGAPPYILPPPYQDPTNITSGRSPFPLPPYPFLPENFNRGNGSGPFPFPPPPPPQNLNQSLDEDDPSIYYPPPYSFFYPKDNSTVVPPGPLVPGIVLPPPPNFFAALNPPSSTSTSTTTTTTTSPTPSRIPSGTHTQPPSRYLPYDEKPQTNIQIIPSRTTSATPIQPSRYLPYDEKPKTSIQIVPSRTATETPVQPPSRYLPYDEKPKSSIQIIPLRTTTEGPVQTQPLRYLPHEEKSKSSIEIIAPTLPTRPNYINFHENELPLENSSPIAPTVSTIPVLRIPHKYNNNYPNTVATPTIPPILQTQYDDEDQEPVRPILQAPKNGHRQRIYTTTIAPPTELPVFHGAYDIEEQRPRTRLRPTTPPPTTPRVPYYQEPSRTMVPPFVPTVSTVSVIQVPRTYLRPTNGPVKAVVQVYTQRPRTYLKPTSGPPSVDNTLSPVPVLQVPFNEQRSTSYLKPTTRPHEIGNSSPVSAQYLPYNNHDRPTAVPPIAHTVSSVPVLRVPYNRQPGRTHVSSTAVPLRSYFSSVDVDTNSVQPQAEYYFYEENVTQRPPIPQRLHAVTPNNFEKHVQNLQQQIQSYIKPAARPVYEYSFQAANYRPSRPPQEYITQNPQAKYGKQRPQEYVTQDPQSQYVKQRPQQYITQNQQSQFVKQRPVPARYQENQQQGFYGKHDDRYLDDITKKYFTMFGQKITTPVTPSISLAGDTLVNYRKPRPPINPDAEFVDVRPRQKQERPSGPGTFISYELPGEGAHFYFLTPQLVQQQQQQQQRAYYYPKPEDSRIPRRNER